MYRIYIAVILAILVSGCSVTPSANIKQDLSSLNEAKLTLKKVNSEHFGSSQAQAFGGLVGRSIANSAADKNHLERLDIGCLKAIGNLIEETKLFDLEEIDEEYTLQLNIHYKIASVLPAVINNQIIALHIDWKLYDKSGAEVASVTTIVRDDTSPEAYPNTQDPRYYENYVKLAERSTEDFINRISGKIPRWGNRKIDTW